MENAGTTCQPTIDDVLEQTWRGCHLPATLIDRSPWREVRSGRWEATARLGRGSRTHALPVSASIQEDALVIRVRDELGLSVIAQNTRELEAAAVQAALEPVWVDPRTGLMWMAHFHPVVTQNWSVADEAIYYAGQKGYAGFNDWKLPSMDCLKALYSAYTEADGGLPGPLFRDTDGNPGLMRLWDRERGSQGSRFFCFRLGAQGHNRVGGDKFLKFACVRGVRVA